MSKPPASPPSSDIEGVNRDARAGAPSGSGKPDPGAAIGDAKDKSKARPDETAPAKPESSGADI